MKDRDNFTFLTSAPVHHVVLVMAVPTIISMLVTSIYNIVTTFYVGRISTQATAAVGIAFSVMAIIQAIGFTFGQGSGNYISRELGAQRHDNACRMASTGFFLAVGTGFVIALIGLIFLRPLALLLGSTPTILPYAETYLSFVLMAAPFMCGALCLNNQMRFQGNAAYSMFGILTGACINVVLAPILIFVFDMGITGAGISTFTGESCSMLVLLWMSRMKRNIHISHRNFTPSVAMLKEIFAGGTPSLTRQGMASISVALLNVAAGAYGDAAIAAMSIVNRIAFVIFAAMIGLGQGFQPMCGFCYGAKLYARVREGYWFIVRVGFLFMAVCAVLGFFFSEECIDVFRRAPRRCFYRHRCLALAAGHASVGCHRHVHQHDDADHPQAMAGQCARICPQRPVLHSADNHPAPFLRSSWRRDVPGMGRCIVFRPCSAYSHERI